MEVEHPQPSRSKECREGLWSHRHFSGWSSCALSGKRGWFVVAGPLLKLPKPEVVRGEAQQGDCETRHQALCVFQSSTTFFSSIMFWICSCPPTCASLWFSLLLAWLKSCLAGLIHPRDATRCAKSCLSWSQFALPLAWVLSEFHLRGCVYLWEENPLEWWDSSNAGGICWSQVGAGLQTSIHQSVPISGCEQLL